jgi:hypothetical protein
MCVSVSLTHRTLLQALQVWKLELQQKWLTVVVVVVVVVLLLQ